MSDSKRWEELEGGFAGIEYSSAAAQSLLALRWANEVFPRRSQRGKKRPQPSEGRRRPGCAAACMPMGN